MSYEPKRKEIGDHIDVVEERVRVHMVKAEKNGQVTHKVLPKPKPQQKSKLLLLDDLEEKLSKEQLNVSVDSRVKHAITLIQGDVQKMGAKKPKIGEIVEAAIFALLKERKIEL